MYGGGPNNGQQGYYQQGGQQQRGQLFGVLWLIRVVVAVLASAGRGSEPAERSFGGLLACASAGRARSVAPLDGPPPQLPD